MIFSIVATVASLTIIGAMFYLIFLRNRGKVPNPEIEKFEAELEQRGFSSCKALFHDTSVYIKNHSDFLLFGKREGVDTIFFDEGSYSKHYFYIVDGKIIRTSIERKVKP